MFQHLPKRPKFGHVFADPPLQSRCCKMEAPGLKTVTRNTKICRSSTKFMPTRVLDLQDLENIKLIHPYVAFSHCWGSSNSFQTTATTKTRMELGFKVDDAPATFRDAILVTRTLVIHYLWIDFICIIQQDSADLAKELSMMGDVLCRILLNHRSRELNRRFSWLYQRTAI